MFFRQIVPLNAAMKMAGHMVPSEDDPAVEVESHEFENGVAYPANTVVWYNNMPYVSVRNVPDNAGTPDTEPDFWGWLYLLS